MDSTTETVGVRYFVDDVSAAVEFYRRLGFEVAFQPGAGFAVLVRGALRLMLNQVDAPGGATQPMPDGRRPEPGGWNRLQLTVPDLAETVAELREGDVGFRGDVVHGRGGDQVLLDDPSGNPVELFQPHAA